MHMRLFSRYSSLIYLLHSIYLLLTVIKYTNDFLIHNTCNTLKNLNLNANCFKSHNNLIFKKLLNLHEPTD